MEMVRWDVQLRQKRFGVHRHLNLASHGLTQLAVQFAVGVASETLHLHVAGHYDEAEDLKVDTHGADVIDPVWNLLQKAYELFGPVPTLLERDFNIPPMAELMQEVDQIRFYQNERRMADARTVA